LNVKNTGSPPWFRTYIEVVDQFKQSWQLSQVAPVGRDRESSNIALGTICINNGCFNYKHISPIIEKLLH